MCHCVYIIPSVPKVPVPILVFQVGIPLEYYHCALPFKVSHKVTHSYIWRYAYQHMYMIRHCMGFYYFYILSLT